MCKVPQSTVFPPKVCVVGTLYTTGRVSRGGQEGKISYSLRQVSSHPPEAGFRASPSTVGSLLALTLWLEPPVLPSETQFSPYTNSWAIPHWMCH